MKRAALYMRVSTPLPAGAVDSDNQLRQIHSDLNIQRRAIHDTRSVLNDAHKLIHAVTKSLAKQPS